jgi:hypothetical protein
MKNINMGIKKTNNFILISNSLMPTSTKDPKKVLAKKIGEFSYFCLAFLHGLVFAINFLKRAFLKASINEFEISTKFCFYLVQNRIFGQFLRRTRIQDSVSDLNPES